MKPEDLNVDISPRLQTINVVAPPVRVGGAKVGLSDCHRVPVRGADPSRRQVGSVEEVVSKMKEAGVL